MIWFGGDDTDGVGVAHSSSPSLNADNGVTAGDNLKAKTLGNTPLEAAVDIFLPAGLVEIGLGLLEDEWIYTTIKVGILLESACQLKLF